MNCKFQPSGSLHSSGRPLVKCTACGKVCVLPRNGGDVISFCGNGQTSSTHGPGTESAKIFKELEIKPPTDCQCAKRQRQMDEWGVEGCETNRETIIGWLKEAASTQTLIEKARIAANLMRTDWFDSLRPYDSILNEAIRRAESTKNSSG